MRSYDEYCAVAKSLDVVGDRWTLLIVRELAIRGSLRYTDIRNGLPGIASNLLAERLRELERAGVVSREEAPPPIATALFSLTERGERLVPVLDELRRWGMPLMAKQPPEDAVRSHWLAFALGETLEDQNPAQPGVTIEVRTGDQPFVLETRDGRVTSHTGSAADPDGVLAGEPMPILGLLFGLLDLEAATAVGVEYRGEAETLERVRAPEPAFTALAETD